MSEALATGGMLPLFPDAVCVEAYTGTAAEWDAFVRAQRGWSHFHLYGWRAIMERVLGHECVYLCARDGTGALAGVLPLVRVRSLLFGHYLVSMPFLNYGGPLGSELAVRRLAEHAVMLARRGRVKLLELRSRHALPIDLPVSHRKVTTVLDTVPGDPDATWRALSPKMRNGIRKATKAGLEVRFGADQVEPFFRVFSRHMRDLGTPTQPRQLFEAIAATFPDDSLFACGWLDGQPVACGAGFMWDGEYEMTWASALREHRSLRVNLGLWWAVMERVIGAGCHLFNFGRSTPGSGTHEFKTHWGSRDETLWWYDVARRGTAATTPSPHDDSYSWGPMVWQRIPVPLATWLGPRIVRGIP